MDRRPGTTNQLFQTEDHHPFLSPTDMEGGSLQAMDAPPNKGIQLDNGLTALLISDLDTSGPSFASTLSSSQTPNRLASHERLTCKEPPASLQPEVATPTSSAEFTSGPHGGARSTEHIDVGYDQHGKVEPKRRHSLKATMPAAFALCIGVGSFHDPDRLQGLAHLLEHTLVMGSEKYPNKNDWYCFLSQHEGSASAYTYHESTVFSLEVRQDGLPQALDIFANLLISPLLKKESMDREVETIQNEYLLEQASDSCRVQQVFGSLACGGHPMRKFICGNVETLRDVPARENIDVNAELIRFFEAHYSPEVMTLAVRSGHSLDELEKMVSKPFSLIPHRLPMHRGMFKTISFATQFTSPQFAYTLYKVQSVKKVNKLSVTWVLPSLLHEYKAKPIEYIAWIVGHEDSGSILAYLRERAWALSLFAGNTGSSFEQNSLCSLFNIFVSLTEEGMKNLNKVLTAIFGFMTMVRGQGPTLTVFEEIKKIGDVNFEERVRVNPQDYVTRLCQNMRLYPPEHYFTGDSLFYEYKPELIQECLDVMVPENANIIVLSSRYRRRTSTVLVDPYLKTKYVRENVPEEWKTAWSNPTPDASFRVPSGNKYITTNFSMKTEVGPALPIPVKLQEDERHRLWYKFGANFEDPKACVYFHFISALPHACPENAIMLAMFVDTLQYNLKHETASARRASLDCSIYASWAGLVIQVRGFTEKLVVLLDAIMDHVAGFEARLDIFENVKKELHRRYFNVFASPSRLADEVRLSVLRQKYWSTVEKRALIKAVTLDCLHSFVQEFRGQLFLEVLAQGNLTAAEACQMTEQVLQRLACRTLPSSEVPCARVMQIPKGTNYCRVATFSVRDPSSVLTNYYQLGPGDVTQHALASLMTDFMDEPCFDFLRNKLQVAHDVNCNNKNTFGVVGFTVTAYFSARKFTCSHVDEQIEVFLRKFSTKVQQMSEGQFSSRVQSLIRRKSYSDFTLRDEADLYWEEITSSGYVFDRLEQEVEFLKDLRADDFKGWCISLLPFNSPGGGSHRRKLSVQVVGYGEAALAESKSFSSTLPATPSPRGTGVNPPGRSESLALHKRYEFFHPWLSRKSQRDAKKHLSTSGSDEVTYTLQYIEPMGGSQQQHFISDVAAFKQGLPAYSSSKSLS